MSHVEFLQLEPTTRCNYTCGFCAGRHMDQSDLDWQTFQASIDAFPALKHVELQGEGESLLHKRFHDMVAALRARDIRVSFISNGSLLSPKHVDALLDAGIEKISVSIESPHEDAFREIRGGKLSKVIRNLEHLMAERARRGLDRPVVGFSVTVLQRTRSDLPEIVALYERLGLDGGITVQPLQQMDTYARHYDDTIAAQELTPAQADTIFMKFFSDAGLRRVHASRSPVLGFYEEMSQDWSPAQRRCPYLEQGMYVHRDGAVTACCMIKDTDRYALGTVGETPEAALIAGREALRAELAAGSVPEPCEGCPLARFAVMSQAGKMWFGMKGLYDRLIGL